MKNKWWLRKAKPLKESYNLLFSELQYQKSSYNPQTNEISHLFVIINLSACVIVKRGLIVNWSFRVKPNIWFLASESKDWVLNWAFSSLSRVYYRKMLKKYD